MKKTVKLSLWFIVVAASLILFAFTVLAVPAAPGTHAEGGACKSHQGQLLTLADVSKTAEKRNRGPMRAPSLGSVKSDVPLAVIVIGLDAMPYREDFDWAQEIFLDDRSLQEYYTDMSFGQFTFTPVWETSAFGVGGNTNAADAENDGVIHVSLPITHDDWRLSFTPFSDEDTAASLTLTQTLMAALEAADAYIDYSSYDVNEDGTLTTDELAIAFIMAGYEASSSINYTHGKTNYLWAHSYSFGEYISDYSFDLNLPDADGVTMDDFIVISEQKDDGTQASIGVLAHELGHFIGLPDMYDTNYGSGSAWSKYEVMYLSLMDYGAYGTDPVTGNETPYSLDTWSRYRLGWVTPEIAGKSGIYTLTSQNYADDASYSTLLIPTQNPDEYYLLENRSFAKWDAGLAEEYGRDVGGIVLWHIDDGVYQKYALDNTVNNTNHRPAMMPLYPEIASDGTLTFIGSNRTVDTMSPFFDKSVWNSLFSALGDTLDLPIYGTGADADKRAGRTLSGIRLAFLSDSADTMRVQVNPQLHVHAPVYTLLKAPTCTRSGAAYYLCECGKRFADTDGATEITEFFVLEALGHTAPNVKGQCDRCGEQLIPEYWLCPFCHCMHTGMPRSFIVFFLRILYFFDHLFGCM